MHVKIQFKSLYLKESILMNRILKAIKGIPSKIAIFLITFYKAAISPLFPSSCRFIPTCSEYGLIAFKRFGFCKGFTLTAKRIMKCRPGGGHGYDPVPDTF